MNENNVTVTETDSGFSPEELLAFVSEKRYAEFARRIVRLNAVDVAEVFSYLPETYYPVAFRLLPKELAAEAFVEMDSDLQKGIIDSFTDEELSAILDELYIDDTVDIIEEMPALVVKRIIRSSSAENRAIINKVLRYPKDTAGSMMTTEYVRFTPEMTVERALSHIRRVAIDKETIYTCYVTDKERRLIGIVTAKELLISALDLTLDKIMETSVISVFTGDDSESVARKLDKYGFLALPVVDAECRLVGIITVDDAMDVIKEETEEDFAKMAAITPTETPYIKTSPFAIWKSRIPWLLLLMISATFSSTILSGFESALPAVLILFVPMLMDTGGNSGGQASVTVIRSISLGELQFKDIFKAILKELTVGAACGATLGAVAFLKVMLIDGLIMQNEAVTLTVALAVSVTLAVTVIVAKLIGAILPLLAKRIGFDPAVMASPLITTVVDALSLVMYFYIARLFLY